jgi:hypothetical protein
MRDKTTHRKRKGDRSAKTVKEEPEDTPEPVITPPSPENPGLNPCTELSDSPQPAEIDRNVYFFTLKPDGSGEDERVGALLTCCDFYDAVNIINSQLYKRYTLYGTQLLMGPRKRTPLLGWVQEDTNRPGWFAPCTRATFDTTPASDQICIVRGVQPEFSRDGLFVAVCSSVQSAPSFMRDNYPGIKYSSLNNVSWDTLKSGIVFVNLKDGSTTVEPYEHPDLTSHSNTIIGILNKSSTTAGKPSLTFDYSSVRGVGAPLPRTGSSESTLGKRPAPAMSNGQEAKKLTTR